MEGGGTLTDSQKGEDSAILLVGLRSVATRDGILLVLWGNLGFILFHGLNPQGVKPHCFFIEICEEDTFE